MRDPSAVIIIVYWAAVVFKLLKCIHYWVIVLDYKRCMLLITLFIVALCTPLYGHGGFSLQVHLS